MVAVFKWFIKTHMMLVTNVIDSKILGFTKLNKNSTVLFYTSLDTNIFIKFIKVLF